MPYQRPVISVQATNWAGLYGGHKGNPAVTLSHDTGQRFKSMGQGGGCLCSYTYDMA